MSSNVRLSNMMSSDVIFKWPKKNENDVRIHNFFRFFFFFKITILTQ